MREKFRHPATPASHCGGRHQFAQQSKDDHHRIPGQEPHQRQCQQIEFACLPQIRKPIARNQRQAPSRQRPGPAPLRHTQQIKNMDQVAAPAHGFALQPLGPFVQKRLRTLFEHIPRDLLGGQSGTRVGRGLTATLRIDENAIGIAFFECAPF